MKDHQVCLDYKCKQHHGTNGNTDGRHKPGPERKRYVVLFQPHRVIVKGTKDLFKIGPVKIA